MNEPVPEYVDVPVFIVKLTTLPRSSLLKPTESIQFPKLYQVQ